MRSIFLLSILIWYCVAAPQPPDQDEELTELPFSTDDFPTAFDDPYQSKNDSDTSVEEDNMIQRRKMKSMFEKNRGPPAITTDLFEDAAVEKNIKNAIYEGSGIGVDENPAENEPIALLPTPESTLYNNNNQEKTANTSAEISEANNGNSSALFDQNTSDSEVSTTTSDESSVIVQAELEASGKEAEKEKVEYGKENEAVQETVKETSVVDYGQNITSRAKKVTTCAPPKFCGRNCFVAIDENGCQGCQCLWVAADCEKDKDCPETNQYCDLGRCNCQSGYRQNMRKSGKCELDDTKSNEEKREPTLKDLTKGIEELKKRKKRASKPRRAERLEWPGVCDVNENCPDGLACIQGDCWSIPEYENSLRRNPVNKNIVVSGSSDEEKRVSFDTDTIEHEPSLEVTTSVPETTTTTTVPTTTTTMEAINFSHGRGRSRFVTENFAKQFQRTTAKMKRMDWFPPTTTVPPFFPRFSPTPQGLSPPITVDKFFLIETTTVSAIRPPRKVVDDHKLENLKQRKANFLGEKEDGIDNEFDAMSHVKKIHLPTSAPILLPLRQQRRKKLRRTTTTASPNEDGAEIEDDISLIDDVEFPISAKIKKEKLKRPRALSANPTQEELEDHKNLMSLFNFHAQEESEVTQKPEVLEKFEASEIQVTAETSKDTEFPPFPILPDEKSHVESVRKPYHIRPRKFTTIAPLENIKENMSSDEPPEVTPEPAPFEQHKMDIWYPMKKGDIPHLGIFASEKRRSPSKEVQNLDDSRLYNEYTKANRRNRPIRIEMDNAEPYVKNECVDDSNCGNTTVCCTKKWCDRTEKCGSAKFCLPSCDFTKLTFLPFTNHAESVVDIMYD